MAGTNLGTAYVTIMPSAKGISGSISKAIGSEATSAGTTAGKNIVGSITKVLAGAGIGLAVKKFFSDAINVGGELEQNLGGTEAVFGDFASSIQNSATEAYKNMGLSASDYMATANKMGSLFQGSGLSQQKSLELTTAAMQRAADVASVMGLDTTAAMESIAGAAKGNFTMMDNLGVAMNATTLSAYALEKGINFNWNTASNAEKAEIAMKMFMERTAQYDGNFAKESVDTFSGSLGAMKAAKDNFMANLALGRDIQGPLHEMGKATSTFLFNNLLPMVGNIVMQIPSIIGSGLKTLFEKMPGVIEGAKQFITNFAEGIKNNSGEFFSGIGELVKAGIDAFRNTDWIGLGQSIINLLWTGITTLAPMLWEGMKNLAATAVEWFHSIDWTEVGHNIIQFIGDAIGNAGHFIGETLTKVAEAAKEFFKDVDWAEAGRNAFHMLVDGLKAIGSYLWDALIEIGTIAGEHMKDIDWKQVGRDVLTFITDGLVAIGSFLWEAIKSIGLTAGTWFKNVDWRGVGVAVITFISSALKSVGSLIWSALKNIGTTAWNTFRDIDWAGVGHKVITFIVNGLKALGSLIWNALSNIGWTAWNTITNIDWWSVGSNIINGIVNGIWSLAGSIGSALYDIVSSAWKSVKNFFGIKSPSKLMRDTVGKWIPLGIAEGIKDEADSVNNAMLEMAQSATDSIDPNFALNATYSGAELGTDTNTGIVVNVYPSAGMDERALADMVQQRLALVQRQRQAVWGTV